MERLFRRTAAFVALAVAVSGWAGCAGWQASAEARMACCLAGDCPMHGSAEPAAGRGMVVTQAQADACCAASGTDNSTPSAVAFPLTWSAALLPSTLSILAAVPVPPASFDAWRTHLPLPLGQVPKHVLLSIFLI